MEDLLYYGGGQVTLWHNNPFHSCTGWVEFNIQEDKVDGTHRYEHPMWLVSSRSPIELSHEPAPWFEEQQQSIAINVNPPCRIWFECCGGDLVADRC